MGLYDDVLDDDQQAVASNPYDAALETLDAERHRTLRQSAVQTKDTTPDAAADAARVAKTLNIPVEVAERNLPAMRQRATLVETPFARIMQESPALGQWASDPENAAVAKDDMETLGALEWLLTAPGRAFQQGIDQVRFGKLKTESLFRELSREERDLLDVYKSQMSNGGALGAGDSWWRKSVVGASNLLPNIIGGLIYAGQYGALGAAEAAPIGAAAGSIMPGVGTAAGAGAAAAYGFRGGVAYGAAKFGFQLEAGLALDEYDGFRDELGRPLDPDVKKAAAMATGLINAGLEAWGLSKFVEAFPGGGKLTGAALRAGVKKALQVPTVRAALAEAMKTYGKTLSIETATEVAQRAVTILSGELAREASGQETEPRLRQEVIEDLVQEGVGALQGFSLTIAPGPAMHVARQRQTAQQAVAARDYFTQLGEGVADSKTFQRAPDQFANLVEQATKNGPVADVYAPTASWREYWQSKNVDPGAAAAEITGQADALEQAEASGQDIRIPMAAYATKLAPTEHNTALANEIRLGDPSAMNAREAEAFLEQARTAAATAPQTPLSDLAPEMQQAAQTIRTNILTQLSGAGVPERTAGTYADLFERAIVIPAAAAGVDPVAYLNERNLRIKREGLATLTEPVGAAGEAPAVIRADRMVARVVDSKAQQGETLTDGDATPTGQGRADGGDERGRAPLGGGGEDEAGRARPGDDSRRLPRLLDVAAADADRVFERAEPDVDAGRLTQEVRRELERIADELEQLTFTSRTWTFKKTEDVSDGNAAGGHADIVAGGAGSEVLGDILQFAPLNKSSKADREIATKASASRTQLAAAVRKALEKGTIHNNLAEGAVRVAERRAAGDYRDLSRPMFPPHWGEEAPAGFVDQVDELIETALEDGDTSFDPSEFGQSLFDLFEEPKPAVDTLDTGEQQPRLPGAEDVREQEVQTPEFEAPFSLTSPVDKSTKGKQTELFQSAYHGTPHVFEEFSLQHIGTGEGAQAYGWGLYFASRRDVAEEYRRRLTGHFGRSGAARDRVEFKVGNDWMQWDEFRDAMTAVAVRHDGEHEIAYGWTGSLAVALAEGKTLEEARKSFTREREFFRDMAESDDFTAERKERTFRTLDAFNAALDEVRPEAREAKQPGRLFTVEVPEDDVLLDWDKPASQQPEKVKEALGQLGIEWQAFKVKTPAQLRRWFEGPTAAALVREDIGIRESINEGYALLRRLEEGDPVAGYLERWQYQHQGLFNQGAVDATGEELYRRIQQKAAIEHRDRHFAGRLIAPGPYTAPSFIDAARMASESLNALGVVGIKYLDGNSRQQGEGSHNFVVFDDRLVQVVEYNQPIESQNQERRGSIQIAPDRSITINLFEKADLSTFLHESAHLFLEVWTDLANHVAKVEPAQRTDAQRRILADIATLDAWLAEADEDHRGKGFSVAQHELFARTFEAYLMKGEAPSLALQDAFSRFRSWLLGIYRSLTALNAKLTPEVTQVLDRMLATDEEIAAAEARGKQTAMFATAADAGMTDQQFALYRDTVTKASQTARERLEQKLMAEVRREQERSYKERREAVKTEVAAGVHEQPVYRALFAMRFGTKPDGGQLLDGVDVPPLKLAKQTLVDRYGEDFLKRLPRPFIYTTTADGVDPDLVAERYGFSSGDEMIQAVITTPPMEQVIEQETERRMIAEHGSMLLDGTLVDAAQEAVANEDREIVIRAELRALARLRSTVKPFERQARSEERNNTDLQRERAEGAEAEVRSLKSQARRGPSTIAGAVPPASAVRQAAIERVARMRVGDINGRAFWAAARRASEAATAAAAKQDFDAAITAKTQELVNLATYREAETQRAEVERRAQRMRDLGRPAAMAKLMLAGETYHDQVAGVLDRFEFARVSQKALDRRASLRKWVAALEGEGLPVDLPEELLEEQRRVNYRELTLEEFTGVVDGIDQIVHLSRLKNRLLKRAEQRELDDLAQVLAESITEHARGTRREGARDRRPSEERRRTVEDWFAGHRKLASLLREMDGFQDGGAMWDAVMRPLNDAGAREAEMNAETTAKFYDVVERAFPGKEKRRLYEKQFLPAIGKSLSKMERLMYALNWGNEGNRDRIRRAEGWTDGQVQTILDTLSAGDLAFAQDIFDLFESFRPAIGEKQKRITGIEPTWVEATEIKAAGGTIKGGYFPLKYDDRLSAGAIQNLDLEAANLARQAAYAHATTKRGHTKARAESVKMKLRLDFGVMFEHVDQVIHDLTHHEALIDVGRILGHRAVQAAILEHHGDIVYKQMRGTVRDVAFGDIPARSGFERALNHVRAGATIAGLGWNVTTAFLQPLGLFNAAQRIGVQHVARGLSRWLRNPAAMAETVDWITEKSAFMRARGRTQQREINEIRNRINVSTGRMGGWVDDILEKTTFDTVTRAGIADSYFWMIQTMQRVADVPTWLGAYEKAMAANETEDRAIAMADQAVLDSQGGGQIKDLAQVQRGGPMMRLWTNFYSFFNVLYNQATEAHRRTNYRSPADVGRLASDYLLLFIVPAVMGELLKNALRPGDPKDEDRELWHYVGSVASYMSGMMLGVREISGTLQGAYGYEGPAGARFFASLARFGQQVRQGDADAAARKAGIDVAGSLFHLPAAQINRTLDGIAAIEEGKTENPMALLTGAPAKR